MWSRISEVSLCPCKKYNYIFHTCSFLFKSLNIFIIVFSNTSYRYILLTTILLNQIKFSCVVSQRRVLITGLQDKAINTKFVIQTLDMAGQSFNFCLAKCLEDCLCKSFQVCDSSTCELSSIEKDEDTSAFQTRLGCVYYNLDALNVSDGHACSFGKNANMVNMIICKELIKLHISKKSWRICKIPDSLFGF